MFLATCRKGHDDSLAPAVVGGPILPVLGVEVGD